jgi:hypothetical protein
MSKEQQALLGEAYEGYVESYNKGNASGIQLDNGTKRVANIDEFIRRIRQDIPFAEKFGLKFEKRELSLEERTAIFHNGEYSKHDNLIKFKDIGELNKAVPTKLITITYNDTKLESYE